LLSVDPVRPGGTGAVGYNQYTYVGNNPTTWTDPTGRNYAIALTVSRVLTAFIYATGFALAITTPILLVGLCLQGVICPPLNWPRGSDETKPGEPGGGGGGGGTGSLPIPAPWVTGSLSPAVLAALAALGIVAADLALRDSMPIYRVWGGLAPEDGRSWSPIDPRLVETLGPGTYRNLAGLPIENSGEFVATGTINLLTLFRTGATEGAERILEIVKAGKIGDKVGGLPEIRFINRADVRLNVHGITSTPANPRF
jgi:hypothetical protein